MTWDEAKDWFLDNMPIKWLAPKTWNAQMQAIKALYFTSAIHDAAEMQRAYQTLEDGKQLTKRNIVQTCAPFRDKYGLTDLQTLKIARKEMDLSEMIFWLEVNSPWG